VKPDGMKMEKLKTKVDVDQLTPQFGELVKSKEDVMEKHLETKMVMVEKKHILI
jgi:hypothetical protein